MKWLAAILVLGGCLGTPDRPTNNARHWNLRSDAREPGPMYAPRLVYDDDLQEVLMFAGSHASVLSNQVFALDGTGWTQICTEGTAPSPRLVPQVTYSNHRLIVAGGTTNDLSADTLEPDVYECDPSTNTWTQTIPSLPTAQAGGGALEYQGQIYVVGGLQASGDVAGVRTLQGNAWTDASGLPTGVASYSSPVTLDTDHDQIVAFTEIETGMGSPTDDLFAFNGAWASLCHDCSGTPRVGASIVAVPGESIYLIAGNHGNAEYGGTSMLVDDSFVSISDDPGARDSFGVAYDAARDVVVLYGGNGPSCMSSGGNGEDCAETWELVK